MQVTFSRVFLCSRCLFVCISNLFCFNFRRGYIHFLPSCVHPVTTGAWGRRWMLVWNGPATLHRRQDGDVLVILLAQDDGNWTEGRVRTALTNVTSRNLGELETSSGLLRMYFPRTPHYKLHTGHRHLPPDFWEIRWSVATSQYSTDKEYGESLTDAHNIFADRIFYHSYPHNLE